MRCPICEREFDPAKPAAAKPFCSERCRLVDLGRWLGESYALPGASEVEPDADARNGEAEGREP
jgi:endogenous inhibitor of DNA gyrase (YacG/DUF329 family)